MKILDYQSYFIFLLMPFFEILIYVIYKLKYFKQRIVLTIWKSKHSVKQRTNFEYIRNIAVILEANQLPNLLFEWIFFTLKYMCQSETLCINSNLLCFHCCVWRFFCSGYISPSCTHSYSLMPVKWTQSQFLMMLFPHQRGNFTIKQGNYDFWGQSNHGNHHF